MTPEMRARITARNETAAGFAEVKRDAMATANAIEASSARAAAGLAVQNRALATTGSLSRMAAAQQRNLVFQLNDIGVSLASGMNPLMVAAQQGSQIATIYGPGEGGIGRALQETGKLAVGMVTKFWPIGAAVGAATGAVAAMTSEINKASDVQVSFGDVAMASWQVFADGVYSLVEPAISSIIGWLGSLWETVRPSLVNLGNGIVATFVGAYNSVTATWAVLPAALGDIVITTANAVVDGVELMVNGSIGLINDFTRGARSALGAVGLDIGDIGSVDIGSFANPFAGAADGVAGQIGAAFGDAFSTDFLGQAFDAIKNKAIELASATDVASDSLKAANDNAKALGNTLNKDLADAADKSSMSMLGAFGQLSGALGQLFNDNKAFAVATAVINTAEGITKALAQGGALGFVSAAAVAASGAAQVATILSAQPGSASAPSVGGSAPATAAAGAGGGPASPGVNITLRGNSFSADSIEGLFDQLQEYLGDRGKVLVTRAA